MKRGIAICLSCMLLLCGCNANGNGADELTPGVMPDVAAVTTAGATPEPTPEDSPLPLVQRVIRRVQDDIKARVRQCIPQLIRRIECRITTDAQLTAADDDLLIHQCQICRLDLLPDIFKQRMKVIDSALRLTALRNRCMQQHIPDHDD